MRGASHDCFLWPTNHAPRVTMHSKSHFAKKTPPAMPAESVERTLSAPILLRSSLIGVDSFCTAVGVVLTTRPNARDHLNHHRLKRLRCTSTRTTAAVALLDGYCDYNRRDRPSRACIQRFRQILQFQQSSSHQDLETGERLLGKSSTISTASCASSTSYGEPPTCRRLPSIPIWIISCHNGTFNCMSRIARIPLPVVDRNDFAATWTSMSVILYLLQPSTTC